MMTSEPGTSIADATSPYPRAGTPAAAISQRRAWQAVVLSVSLLMIGLDNTILNVALPALQRNLGATTSQLQWTVDAYLLAFAGLLLAAGNLGDRVGRRRAVQAGLIIFGLGSALAALSATAPELIASRALGRGDLAAVTPGLNGPPAQVYAPGPGD
jgi:MFS family permease